MKLRVPICDFCVKWGERHDPLVEGVTADGDYCRGCGERGNWSVYEVEGTLGDPRCTDCCTMSMCYTHNKIEGLYPEDWIGVR